MLEQQTQPWRELLKETKDVPVPEAKKVDGLLRFSLEKDGACDTAANGASAPPPPPPPPGSA